MSRIILHDELKAELISFSEYVVEITIFGDFTYNRQRFLNLPAVRIVIEEIDYEDVCADVMVVDDYSHVIPYLKANKCFRDLLEQAFLTSATPFKTSNFWLI